MHLLLRAGFAPGSSQSSEVHEGTGHFWDEGTEIGAAWGSGILREERPRGSVQAAAARP